jgi:hypothetical protein
MAVRTWVWVTIAVLGVLAVGCFTVIGTGIYMVSRQIEVTETSEQAAVDEMQQVRARFEGQAPFLALDERGRLSDAELKRRAAVESPRAPETLRVMIWDQDENRIMRVSIPFWLMRFSGSGYDLDLGEDGKVRVGKVRVNPKDLERAGPGLVMDHQEDGSRTPLWTE